MAETQHVDNSTDSLYLATFSKKLILSLFLIFLIVLCFLLYLNYQNSKKRLIFSIENTFSERAIALDASVKTIVKHVMMMKSVADQSLTRTVDKDFLQNYKQSLKGVEQYNEAYDYYLLTPGKRLGLHEIRGSVFGKGSLNHISPATVKNILLGLDLFDMQQAEHQNNPNIVLSYYISNKDYFSSIYPGIDVGTIVKEFDRDLTEFIDYAYEVYNEFAPKEKNPGRDHFWTKPYVDRAGNGMMVTCAVPLDYNSEHIGVLGADVILNFLDRFTTPIEAVPGNMILVSHYGQVISASNTSYKTEEDVVMLKDILPAKLSGIEPATFKKTILVFDNQMIFAKKMENVPWTLLYVFSKESLQKPLIFTIGIYFSIIFLVVCIFCGSYYYLYKRFIEPGIQSEKDLANLNRNLDRKVAERIKEINQLRNYLSNIINSMPSILVGVNLDGTITHFNLQAEKETGIKESQAIGKKLEAIFPRFSNDAQLISDAIQMRKTKKGYHKEREENGDIFYEEILVFPLIANGVEGAVIRVDDKTEQKNLEELMIQNEKMLTVGGLAAGMAHEINNPISGVMQNAQVAMNRLNSGIPANETTAKELGISMEAIQAYAKERKIVFHLERVRDSAARAAKIVQNMLGFARKSDRTLSSHNITELLDNAVELAKNDYDLKKNYDFRTITIHRDYEKGLPMAICESIKIQQVFLNVLKNGAQAMSTKAEGTADDEWEPVFNFKVHVKDSFICIIIQDNGPGIDEDILDRVFEPFFTSKPVGEGTGLGLSVSYFIITQNHNGKLLVESKKNEGTSFIIQLPLDN